MKITFFLKVMNIIWPVLLYIMYNNKRMFKYLYLGKNIHVPAVSIIAEQSQGDGDLILSRRRRGVPGGGGPQSCPGSVGWWWVGRRWGRWLRQRLFWGFSISYLKKPVLVKRCVLFMISKMEFEYIEYNYP